MHAYLRLKSRARGQMDKFHISTTREGPPDEINPGVCAPRRLALKRNRPKSSMGRRGNRAAGPGKNKFSTIFCVGWGHDSLLVPYFFISLHYSVVFHFHSIIYTSNYSQLRNSSLLFAANPAGMKSNITTPVHELIKKA